MEDVVKYNNQLNSICMSGFSALDLDALMMLCAQLKERKTEVLEFSFHEIKQTLHLENETDDKLITLLKRMNRKLNLVNGHYENEDEIVDFVLFPTFRTMKKEKKLQVQVNSNFVYLLNGLTKNFTRFELSEFIDLESKYSKSLYRLLKQYRSTGIYYADADKLRNQMDCPKSYLNKIFVRDCLNVAIKELEKYFDGLTVNIIKAHKRGAPIVGYEFTFKPQKEDKPSTKPEKQKKDTTNPKTKQNKFNNFHQRDDYDFDELERRKQQSQQ